MKLAKLADMVGGWFVGHFTPNIYQTNDFEVAVKYYQQGDHEQYHVHHIAREITVILEGQAEMAGRILEHGDIIMLEPGEGTAFKALTDLKTVVVKTPSVPCDKHLVAHDNHAK